MQSTYREAGIDLLKIVACCLVVAIHTVDARLGVIHRIIQMSSVIAIPTFFAINGYFVLGKRRDHYWKYIAKKTTRIILVCFLWEFLHSIAYFAVYGKPRNFLLSFALDFIQQGLFFHFWFLGALILIYLFVPLLARVQQRNARIYYCITAVLGIACVVIDIMQFVCKAQFINAVPQTFRLWMWMFYFMVGGLLAQKKERIKAITFRGTILPWLIGAVSLMLTWMWFGRQYAFGKLDVAGCYGALPVIVTVVLIFICAIRWRAGKRTEKAINRTAKLTMGVYIVHPFVLSIWTHFFPAFEQVGLLNLLYYLCVIISSGIVALVILCLPYIRELIHL